MSNKALPKVIIVTTGGTIASQVTAPMLTGQTLIQAIPQLVNYAKVEVIEFSQTTSAKITPDHWLRMAQKINDLFSIDSSLRGIVITHGTDTMEETAYFLHMTIKDRRPVILTGAMRTFDEISADGPGNLINALRVVVDDKAVGKGVMLVMNENILSAHDAWKSDNRRAETFQSTGFGYLGIADPDRIQFYRQTLLPHTVATPFNISEVTNLPKVDIVSDFTGFDREILEYFADRNPDGLVFQSFAGGRLSKGAEDGLVELTKKFPVVIASKVPLGRIIGNPNPRLEVTYAYHLPANKARILLMLVLIKHPSPGELQTIYNRY